jgi:SAM-dependent methyltransferase
MPASAFCRVCDSTDLQPAIDLGLQPWGNHFLKKEEVGREPKYPLRVAVCADCRTAQLDFTVPKETMFSDHTYVSGVTRSLADHFERVATEVTREFFQGKEKRSVLDIGSNDGTQLKSFKKLGYEVLGVEPSLTAFKLAQASGIPTVHKFYNQDTQRSIGRKFDVINAAGVFFHLEELHSVAEAIREALEEEGVFVVQFLYMKEIVANGAFDQIYHEHLVYYTLKTVETLLNRHGLALFDAVLSPIHGGSIIAYAGHRGRRPATRRLEALRAEEERSRSNELSTYKDFQKAIEERKRVNLEFLRDAKKAGKRVFGLGAPVKGNTLLNYFGAGPELIEKLVERNPLRRGLFSPGMHIPVVVEDELTETPDIYYVLAWNFKREILQRYAPLLERGVRFYFPVEPRTEE